MNPRERLVKTLNHQEPDIVPIDIGSVGATTLLIPTYENLKQQLGFNGPIKIMSPEFYLAMIDEEVLQKLQIGLRSLRLGKPPVAKKVQGEDYFTNEWGVTYYKPSSGYYYDISKFPLAGASSPEDIEKYHFPDPSDPSLYEDLEDRASSLFYNTEYAIIAETGNSIFEQAWYLRGLENIFNDMCFNKKLLHTLLRKITDINLEKTKRFLDKAANFIQVYFVGDDLASQNGSLISVPMYREFIKPYQGELYAYIKKRTDAKIAYHSCGSLYQLIPELIQIGVEVINPVQVSAKNMDTTILKREFGKDISFWGAIDTQKVLPFGTEKEIAYEVKKRIDDLAPGGGYVLASVHAIQPDVSPKNIMLMLQYAEEYGKY
ncbi:MAG: hypothetical protein NTX88_02805 [Candidatus Atribacteria bacterium]|nr:hypothetical protein [Candidatus Atribacteria bacterium]